MADVTVTAANVALISGSTSQGTAGATITAGQVLYKDSSDSNNLKLADADSSEATATVEGIALTNADSGELVIYARDGCVVNIGGTLTAGGVYVLSGTAGGIAPVADLATSDYTSLLGVASTTANLTMKLFNSGVQVA